eukprot:183844-Hanusia_phi.AAC.1
MLPSAGPAGDGTVYSTVRSRADLTVLAVSDHRIGLANSTDPIVCHGATAGRCQGVCTVIAKPN